MKTQIKQHFASCLCQSVQLSFAEPVNWIAHCHCTMCQKANGAAFVTWLGINKEKFEITKGKSYLSWYQSSADASRAHCKNCGTPMLFTSSRWKDEVHVSRALVDTTLSHPVDCHAFYDTHVNWSTTDPDLPKRGGQSGTEPLNE
ncbi:GFA family protein [Pleionea sediminis]|uniref:GFA family protein n=1 Tax=Pleionea sediminis TaxID=2569479 RepID=UPI0011863BD3|nr:GFA family protein [Pleionea sediminis]